MRYAALGAMALAIALGSTVAGGGGGGSPGLFNIFVGAAGSCTRSSTPVVYNAATSCGNSQSWSQAYVAANSGDSIGVEPGTYENQIILRDAGKGTSGPAVTFSPDGGVVTLSGGTSGNPALSLGGSCKCSSGKPPVYITLDGGASRNLHTGTSTQFGQIKVYPDYEANPANDVLPDHLTFKNMIMANASPDPGGGTLELASDTNTLIDNVQIGPICCGLTMAGADNTSPTHVLVGHRDEGASSHMTTNLTVLNSQFLGETYCGAVGGGNPNCTHADWPSSLGSPPQANCSDPDACHADCFHFTGIDGLVFEHNILYSCRAQALFMENQNGGYSKDGTIIDNYLDSLSACAFCVGGTAGQVHTTRGTWIVAFNTANGGFGFSGPSTFDTSGSITVVGNLGGLGNHGDDTNNDGCSFAPSGWTVTYNYNVFTNMDTLGGGPVSVCNGLGTGNVATDTYPVLPVVNQGDWGSTPSDNTTNYALTGSSAADNIVPSATCTVYTTRDVGGQTRPTSGTCDAGGDEH